MASVNYFLRNIGLAIERLYIAIPCTNYISCLYNINNVLFWYFQLKIYVMVNCVLPMLCVKTINVTVDMVSMEMATEAVQVICFIIYQNVAM